MNPNLMFRFCAALLFVYNLAFAADPPGYRQWVADCARLPSNRELKGRLPNPKLLPLATFADFETGLDGFLALDRKGELSEREKWVNGAPDSAVFFDTTRSWFGVGKAIPFQPFAGKLVLRPDATVIAIGDLHGDIRSLLQMLEELNRREILDGFAVRQPNHHLIFTGDLTDRGSYGTEVLYTLFRLKMASPAQVHIARGNHEDIDLASRYGFLDELRGKYGGDANVTKLMRAYDLLPVVIYLGTGTDFLQINHGGMEPGYDPRALLAAPGNTRFQLLGELKQKSYAQARPGWLGNEPAVRELATEELADFTPVTPSLPRMIGFVWNDFTVFRDEPQLGLRAVARVRSSAHAADSCRGQHGADPPEGRDPRAPACGDAQSPDEPPGGLRRGLPALAAKRGEFPSWAFGRSDSQVAQDTRPAAAPRGIGLDAECLSGLRVRNGM
jgi:hypothetical protein